MLFKRNKKKKEEEFQITIVCKKNEKWKNVFQRYCTKTNEKRENLLFIFDAKNLEDNETVASTVNIINMSKIRVIDVENLDGGK